MKFFSLYVGLRYTRAKRRNQFISFISLASMLGIALGVAVLITVMSVFNGFDEQIKKSVFSIVPQLTLSTRGDITHSWQDLAKGIAKTPGIVGYSPFISGNAIVSTPGQVDFARVVGVLPKQEETINALNKKMVAGSLDSLVAGQYKVVVGAGMAANMGLTVGSKLTLIMPRQLNYSPFGVRPRLREFTVSGIFAVGSAVGPYDSNWAFVNMTDASKLFPGEQAVSGINFTLNNIYAANEIIDRLTNSNLLPEDYNLTSWMDTLGAFFKAVAMEKTMMMIILLLIVAIAAFNLVSTLVMVVNDKRADIAILRTLGATPKTIMLIFIVQGALIGLIGTALGILLGCLLAANASVIVDGLQHLLHVQFVSSSIYFIDYLPSKIEWLDIVHIAIAAFSMSLIATLYPAWQAFRIQPAEALRYE